MPSRRLVSIASLAVAAASALTACGGSPTAPSRDEVFYLHGGGVIDKNRSWEVYFPPLDQPKSARMERIVGVGVLDGDVRLGRPVDWALRDADYTPGRRFISYQSPRQFLFTIYERVDHPRDTWTDVLRRYEEDVENQGSTILSARMPTGTANSQGRSYFLKTRVVDKPDREGFAHEILVRNNRRVLLVQVVHDENLEPIADEVVHAIRSMTVY